MATDYDCWKDEHVDVSMVMATMHHNSDKAQKLLLHVLPKLTNSDCACRHFIEGAKM